VGFYGLLYNKVLKPMDCLMTPKQLDQMIFETTQQIDVEVSKLKNLASEKIFTVEEQKQQKKNWQNLIEQKSKTVQRSKEERDNTSRKIIVGSIYLTKMFEDPEKYALIFSLLEKTLVRDRDRDLFGFKPLSNDQKILRKSK
jgi:hypothetical protein